MPRRQDIDRARDTVAVIGGTGALGFGLALRWAAAGVPVVIGSRRAEAAAEAGAKVRELAGKAAGIPPAPGPGDLPRETGAARAGGEPEVDGTLNPDAARRSRTVFLCVPLRAQIEILESIRPGLEPGSVLVDATVPLAAAVGGKPTRTLGLWQGSAAEQARELVPRGVTVVSALHTVSGTALRNVGVDLTEDVLLCGDDAPAKRQVAELVERIDGLRAVDCGPLETSRITEQLTALLIAVNKRYRARHAGVRLTGLPDELW